MTYLFLSQAPISAQSLPLVGGRLASYWEAWAEIGADPSVVQTVREGYKIPIVSPPPLADQPLSLPTYPLSS